MNKPITFLIAVTALALAACAQKLSTASAIGTIDGRSIPDDTFQVNRHDRVRRFIRANHRLPTADEEQKILAGVSTQEICRNLSSVIGDEARESERLRLGIVPTKAAIEAVASHTTGASEKDVTAAYPMQHAWSAALAAGFAAVLDNGRDPHVTYQQVIVPAHPELKEDGWLEFLYTARTSAKGRKRLEHDSTLTLPQMIAEQKAMMATSIAAPAAKSGMASAAVYYLLNDKVDQLISSKDPLFRTYLAEFPDPFYWSGHLDHHQYLEQKRNHYWRDVRSKLKVRLKDPTLFDTCGLVDMDITKK